MFLHINLTDLFLLGQFVESDLVVIRVEEDAQPVGGELAAACALRSDTLDVKQNESPKFKKH